MDKRKAYRNNQEITLTVKEYKILCFLVANRNRVLTYEQICQRVWGEDVRLSNFYYHRNEASLLWIDITNKHSEGAD